MQPSDDDGAVLDAEYHVEPDGQILALILGSWGGGEAGLRPPRNPDYNRALATLLRRLAHLDAVLVSAFVDSRQTQVRGLPEADRMIFSGPVRLSQEPDLEALRRQMGAAQARVGSSPERSGGGNRAKRIRLRLDVPGFLPGDAQRLEKALATAVPVSAARSAFILTWNPDRWTWPADEYAQAVRATAAGEPWMEPWSVGLRKGGVAPGDRAFLLRQKQDRGVVASGLFISGLETDEHWDGSGRPTMYARIDWDTVLEVNDRLPVEVLMAKIPEVSWDRIQGSGVAVPDSCSLGLAQLWAEHKRGQFPHPVSYPGAPSQPSWPTAGEVLRSLIGEEIRTITGSPDTVLAIHSHTVMVATSRSPHGQPVEISDVQHGMDKLRARGSVRVTVEELGHRSAFVGAVLATLPGVHATGKPATITLGADGLASSDPHFAALDGTASVKVRREQALLRSMLADGRELANCALCDHQYPLRFLVAAHIKKRSQCTDDERRDLRHVAMLACAFGCDALYEAGWIIVGPDGRIQGSPPGTAPAGRLADHLQQLVGQHCKAHNRASEPYFAWHRETHSPRTPTAARSSSEDSTSN